ncbi:hypothetical protein DV096_14230 [Bradymonadaceae bacterium TMQ3]|uniref:Uncharacterized protein n=1 Tax=Lujinxingia sediminis TaxID=2480984 RepID=A0ABY0CPN3_9DELT|nr:hypothetical protein [Lujinxingia sediminis]RDV37657.1 hypothetical protein DV096_14230 [Bradymonadaceae bacterium TMQ3]RVU42117.1 hypothetical protein EA187_17410 [Lujinxingia sediminis]TXC75210.1 hypothetical protein FRC91_14100 [Bradymonadales bacterium TMQ1]
MAPKRRRLCSAALTICALLITAACSGDPTGDATDNTPDTGESDTTSPEGLSLQGELVPSGGVSMSSSYTLSGQLNPAAPRLKSESANYRLELTPASSTTGQ